MAETHIQIGETDGFLYLGIEPPLTSEQRNVIASTTEDLRGLISMFKLQRPHNGSPYSELGIMTEVYPSPESANRGITKAAIDIATLLRATGEMVEVDEEFHRLGFGYYLFEGTARRLG